MSTLGAKAGVPANRRVASLSTGGDDVVESGSTGGASTGLSNIAVNSLGGAALSVDGAGTGGGMRGCLSGSTTIAGSIFDFFGFVLMPEIKL